MCPTTPRDRERGLQRFGPDWLNRHNQMITAAANSTRILDLYEIGRGKKNRPTEAIFVERCLKLLKPGGRMGIILPDGNLNNPSMAWLRRWCEGEARILAVVSLPEDTFRSSRTTAKTSVVFLRRFTEDEAEEWQEAWRFAHGEHDADFNSERDALCGQFEIGILTGGDDEVAGVLASLNTCGVTRTGPQWSPGVPPAYPQGVGATKLTGSSWIGEPLDQESKRKAAELKRRYTALLKGNPIAERSRGLAKELRSELKKLDERHNRALWAAVREKFDYPVFVASPTSVGISSGVDEVPNQLPAVRDAFRRFQIWCEEGAVWQDMPDLFPHRDV